VSDEFPAASSDFAIGSQIAGYRLEEQIGRGGMAVVYRAYDLRLDRNVALKILAPSLARDDAFRQRFIRESRAAAAVDHPNIIPIFDAGEANGVLFIAMRFVHGGDVRTLVDAAHPMPAARAADIVSQVASALDAAHARGLVHRDVKPANILLDATPGAGRQDHVYLSDFGLSKHSLSQTGLTSQGQFLGTVEYVAPEQIKGHRVDGRADLYALACAAFELLCGDPPFRRDGGLAVVWAKLSESPPRLTDRRADLPPAVDGVLAKAMAKSPAGRFGSCGEFAAALREALGLGQADTAASARLPRFPRLPGSRRPPAPRSPTEIASPSGGQAAPRSPTEIASPSGEQARGPAAGRAGGTARDGRPAAAAGQTEPSLPVQSGDLPLSSADMAPLRGRLSPRGDSAAPAWVPGRQGSGTIVEPAPRGSWWRSRAVMSAAAVVVVLGVAAGAFAASHGGGAAADGALAAVKAPGCTTRVTVKAGPLSGVRSHSATLGGNPFGVSVTADGKYSFVSLGNAVAVLDNGHGSLPPTQVATIPASGADKGEAITRDGKYLLVAAASGAYVISVPAAEAGGGGAVLGILTSPGGKGAVEVSISPDDRFVFVTLQNSAALAVFNLRASIAGGFGRSGYVGLVPLGPQPVGIAQSPDRQWLYVASERPPPGLGKLYVLSMRRAETEPAKAVQATATAGCSPARVIVSADGTQVWVTDRGSNALVAFSAAKLLTKSSKSLIARVNVGQTPIGLTFIKDGREIMVADSNLNKVPEADSLALISTQKALQGQEALLGFVPSGHLPREFGLEVAAGVLLVTDSGSGQLQAVDTGSLP